MRKVRYWNSRWREPNSARIELPPDAQPQFLIAPLHRGERGRGEREREGGEERGRGEGREGRERGEGREGEGREGEGREGEGRERVMKAVQRISNLSYRERERERERVCV